MARTIYIAMNGSIGCLPDNSEAFTSKLAALEYVKDLRVYPHDMGIPAREWAEHGGN